MFSSHMAMLRVHNYARGRHFTNPSILERPLHASMPQHLPTHIPPLTTSLTSHTAAYFSCRSHLRPHLSAKLYKLPSRCRKYASTFLQKVCAHPKNSTILQFAHFWAVSMTPTSLLLHHSCFTQVPLLYTHHYSSSIVRKKTTVYDFECLSMGTSSKIDFCLLLESFSPQQQVTHFHLKWLWLEFF